MGVPVRFNPPPTKYNPLSDEIPEYNYLDLATYPGVHDPLVRGLEHGVLAPVSWQALSRGESGVYSPDSVRGKPHDMVGMDDSRRRVVWRRDSGD
jgi:hypothetical protein